MNFFTYKFGLGLGKIVDVLSYIFKYEKWNIAINQDKTRYIKDEGGLPLYPMNLTSGNSLNFSGTQYIPINDIDTSLVKNISFAGKGTDLIVLGVDNSFSTRLTVNEGEFILRLSSINIVFNYRLGSEYTMFSININEDNTADLYIDGIFEETAIFSGTITNTFPINVISKNDIYYNKGQLDYITISSSVIASSNIKEQYDKAEVFFQKIVEDNSNLFSTDFGGNDKYIADSKKYEEINIITDGFENLDAWTGRVNVTPTIEQPRDGFNTTFVKIIPTSSGLSVLFSAVSIGSGDYFGVSFRYRTNGTSNSIACGGNNDEILPINTGNAKRYSYISTPGNRLKVYLVAHTGTYLEIDDIEVDRLAGLHQIQGYSSTQRTDYDNSPLGLQDAKRDINKIGFYDYSVSHWLNYKNQSNIATTDWNLLGSWTLYEIVKLNGIVVMFAYTSTGLKYKNGIADGTYTLPTSIQLDSTTFDNITEVTEHRMIKAVQEIETPEIILSRYQTSITDLMFEDVFYDNYGELIYDENRELIYA